MLTRVCHYCSAVVLADSYCASCVASWPERPSASALTVSEKLAELEMLEGPINVPVALIHDRVEALVGRRVLRHELGTAGAAVLRMEIETGVRASFSETLAPLRGVPLFVVVAPE